MSKRRYGEKALILSIVDEILNQLSESQYKAFTDRIMRNLINTLRKWAKDEGWSFRVFLCSSKGGKSGRLHIHMYLQGNPASTMEERIRRYWAKRFGVARVMNGYNSSHFVDKYMNPQSLISKEQSFDFQELDSSQSSDPLIQAHSEPITIPTFFIGDIDTHTEADTTDQANKGKNILQGINDRLVKFWGELKMKVEPCINPFIPMPRVIFKGT